MHKFFIIFKNSSVIEGSVNCSEEEFKKRFISPWEKEIHSYSVKKCEELEEKDTVLIKIDELINSL